MLQGAPKSTRDDPDYVKNYFAASRLHFIGTWKVRIVSLASCGEAAVQIINSMAGG